MAEGSQNSLGVKISAVVIFGLSLVVNWLASTRILGGKTTGEVSDAYPNLFAPAGVTFAIWGVIYVLLFVFCIRLFISTKRQTEDALSLISLLPKYFIAVTLLNMAWLFAWQYEIIWLAMVLIVAMLATLTRVSAVVAGRQLSHTDWLTLSLPFSVYFGWITVATIANVTAFLVSIEWNGWGFSDEAWTLAVLMVGAVIAAIVSVMRRNWPYAAVFVWAYGGIWFKHMSGEGYAGAYPTILSVLLMLVPVLALMTLWLMYKWPKGG